MLDCQKNLLLMSVFLDQFDTQVQDSPILRSKMSQHHFEHVLISEQNAQVTARAKL
jgi:hypothetical protein